MTTQTVTQTVTLLVLTPVQVVTTTLPAAVQNQPYNVTLVATGGVGPYTWAVPAGSTLPPGLSLSPAGVLSGTPTVVAYPTPNTFTVQVTDTGA